MLFITYEPYIEKDEIITYNLYGNYNSECTSVKPECFICYECIYEKQLISKIINVIKYSRTCRCNVSVHAYCFDKWFVVNNNCPVCRTPVVKNNYCLTNANSEYNIFLENHWKVSLANFILFIYVLYNQIMFANEL